MPERAADAGNKWAHAALEPDAMFYYVSATGFEDGFNAAIAETNRTALCWSLDDLYAGHPMSEPAPPST